MPKNSVLTLFIFLNLLLVSCQWLNTDPKLSKEQIDQDVVEESDDEESDTLSLSPPGSSSYVAPERLYNIDQIDDTIILPMELTEISGLSYDDAHGHLLANNDEMGIIYHLNMDGSIARTEKFAKNGDYEGIERIDEDIVVTKQNGNLYFYSPETQLTTEVKTDLSAKNDIEGLAYDKDHQLILMACKGQSLNGDKDHKEKVVYAYNLKLDVLHQEPYLVMSDPVHQSFVEYQIKGLNKHKKKALQKRVKGFAPSGIAINPINRDLYIISARASLIIIYDHDHELKDIMFLDEDVIPQPEGICFSPAADLYISTEGKGFSAKIFKFRKI